MGQTLQVLKKNNNNFKARAKPDAELHQNARLNQARLSQEEAQNVLTSTMACSAPLTNESQHKQSFKCELSLWVAPLRTTCDVGSKLLSPASPLGEAGWVPSTVSCEEITAERTDAWTLEQTLSQQSGISVDRVGPGRCMDSEFFSKMNVFIEVMIYF